MVKSEFYIDHDKFQDLYDKAVEWYIKSWKYPINSDEWQVCRFKYQTLRKISYKYLGSAVKQLNG
jgi:hypothetical protein